MRKFLSRSLPAALLAMTFLGLASRFTLAQSASTAPKRVVSMNVCTDQLAMLLAGDGQLHSVSNLAGQPETSVLANRADRYVVNYGRAEEIFVMRPDLVLAGTFTTRAAVGMLERLGFRVELFEPENSFADIRKSILRMGALLGRQSEARAITDEFDAEVASLEAERLPARPLAALYYPNSYTSGSGTLAAAVVEQAGLENLGTKLGLAGTVKLPLELLVTGKPDLVVTGNRSGDASSEATAILDHPALRSAVRPGGQAVVADRYWVCGLPFTIEAARRLATVARSLERRQTR